MEYTLSAARRLMVLRSHLTSTNIRSLSSVSASATAAGSDSSKDQLLKNGSYPPQGTVNRQVILRKRPSPTSMFKEDDFEVVKTDVPKITAPNQALVKTLYCSIDPTHRIWATDKKQYMAPVALNTVMRAVTLGEVVASSDDNMKPGTIVSFPGGLQDYYIGPSKVLARAAVQPLKDLIPNLPSPPLSYHISLLSRIIGLTAYTGMMDIIKPKPNEIIVVSGAAGAVGSLAGQLAKHLGGSFVVGIAGSKEKCDWLINECKFDRAINYKTQDVNKELEQICKTSGDKKGVSGYFDNVGGKVTEAVYENAGMYCRVAFCGAIANYNEPAQGPKNFEMILHRRMTIQGFISSDRGPDNSWAEFPQAVKVLAQLVNENKLVWKEDVQSGLENYVKTVNMLFTGDNQGKLILKP